MRTEEFHEWSTALDRLRSAFLDRTPEFERFTLTDNGYERVERKYKDAMVAKVRDIIRRPDNDEQAGRQIYRALIPGQGPLLQWRPDDDFKRKFPTLAAPFYAAIGRLARDPQPVVDAIMTTVNAFAELREQGATTLKLGQVANITITVAGVVRPAEAAPFKVSKARELATLLTGDPIFDRSTLKRDQLERWLGLLHRIEAVMRDKWDWQPRDLIDVQGFAWVALGGWTDEIDDDTAILEHFDVNSAFRNEREKWAPDQTAAFCVLANAVHAAGLDWWFVNKPPYELRFGRKDAGRTRATAVLGYVGEPGPWFSANEAQGSRLREALELSESLDTELVPGLGERFAAMVEDDPEFVAHWQFGEPAREGLWPDQTENEVASPPTREPLLPIPVSVPPARKSRDSVNLILYGPPGTGKTYRTMAEAVRLVRGLAPDDAMLIAQVRRKELRAAYEELRRQGQIRFVTFHQSYGYEEFVEGLRPKPVSGGGFTLEPHQGVFQQIAKAAESSGEEHVLIIDEINRANISKVFGELITLIEPDKRIGGQEQLRLTLPHSGAAFGVPANLHIIGTMNTADRSIALIDKALRRRFTFREMMPDYTVEGMSDEIAGAGITLEKVLSTINDRIEYLLDREHQIGHGWLLGCGTKEKLDAVMRDKVIPLIAEYFFEDWGRVADVLGGRQDNPFLQAVKLSPPPGMREDGPRTRWRVREAFDSDAYTRLVTSD